MPAGGALQIQAVGSYFRIQNTTGPVRVQGEFGDLSPLIAGQGIKDSPFTRLMLTNLSALPITGSVIVADKEFVDQQMVMSGSVITATPQDGAYKSVRSFIASFTTGAVGSLIPAFNFLTSSQKKVAITKISVLSDVAGNFLSCRKGIFTNTSGAIPVGMLEVKSDDFAIPPTSSINVFTGASISNAVATGMIGRCQAGINTIFDFSNRPMVLGPVQSFYLNNGMNPTWFTVEWDES